MRQNIAQEVAEYIRQLIFKGELKAGEKVPQDEIAERLGVSRFPVRQALEYLDGEGLVVTEHHRGSFVSKIERQDLEDHYEMFGSIAGIAARRAAECINEDTLSTLVAMQQKLREKEDPSELHDIDWEFHRLINRTGGSRRLRLMLRSLGNNIPWSFFTVVPAASPTALAHHDAILQSLRDGNGDGAESWARLHFRYEGAFVIDMLDKTGLWGDPDM
ncbi:GntR family transcriptional regulator [Streptomyces sp. NPDC020490]|uniref:GntR family transcriptional regulator n=1 Tax=Streptomyces sp. NPDC020490 TaxID=3365078 RepID=UPI0037A26DDE